MADFYFFTELDKLNPQTEEQAFGPVTPIQTGSFQLGKDRFRVTDWHTASNPVKAYSICSGLVCIQPSYDENGNEVADQINIILKPDNQPDFDFPNIKYIVYSGILKSSLVQGVEIAYNSNEALNNDLVNLVQANQKRQNKEYDEENNLAVGTTTAVAKVEALGFGMDKNYFSSHYNDYIYDDKYSIDRLFEFNESNFQIPYIKAGKHIGDFKNTGFGIKIITDHKRKIADMKSGRMLVGYIETDTLRGSSYDQDDEEYFTHRYHKEELLSYIDPCAFFSSFYASKLKVFSPSTNQTNTYKKEEIYENVLKGGFSDASKSDGVFYNRNTLFLDIREEHDYSIDFFDQKSKTVEFRDTQNQNRFNLDYYRSGWPLLAIEQSELFSGVNPFFKLSLPINDPGHCSAFLITEKTGAAWASDKEKKRLKTEAQSSSLLIDYPIHLIYSNQKLISAYLKIIIANGFDLTSYPSQNTDLTPEINHYLDNIFQFQSWDPLLIGLENKIQLQKSAIYIGDTRQLDDDGIFMVGVANFLDTINIVAIAYNEEHAGVLTAFTPGEYPEMNFYDVVHETNSGLYQVEAEVDTVTGTRRLFTLNYIPEGWDDLGKPSRGLFLSIAFKKSEFDSILTLIDQKNAAGELSQNLPVLLTVGDEKEEIDLNGTPYYDHEIYLCGYRPVAGGKVIKTFIATGIHINTQPTGKISGTTGTIAPGEAALKKTAANNSRIRLTSALLKDNQVLQDVADKRYSLAAYKSTGPHVAILGKAIKIVLPELLGAGATGAGSFKEMHGLSPYSDPFVPGMLFDTRLESYVKVYQSFKGLAADGVIGSNTVRALEQDLNEIWYYDIVKEKVIHNRSVEVRVGRYLPAYRSDGYIPDWLFADILGSVQSSKDMWKRLKEAGYIMDGGGATEKTWAEKDELDIIITDILIAIFGSDDLTKRNEIGKVMNRMYFGYAKITEEHIADIVEDADADHKAIKRTLIEAGCLTRFGFLVEEDAKYTQITESELQSALGIFSSYAAKFKTFFTKNDPKWEVTIPGSSGSTAKFDFRLKTLVYDEPSLTGDVIAKIPFNTSIYLSSLVYDLQGDFTGWCNVNLDLNTTADPENMPENLKARFEQGKSVPFTDGPEIKIDLEALNREINGSLTSYTVGVYGMQGYVEIYQIWNLSQPPSANAILHKISPGETLQQVAERYYDYGTNMVHPVTGEVYDQVDKRFFAYMLLWCNNPEGTPLKWRNALDREKGLFNIDDVNLTKVQASVYIPNFQSNYVDELDSKNQTDPDAFYNELNERDFQDKTWADLVQRIQNGPALDWADAVLIASNYTTPNDNYYMWIPDSGYAHAMLSILNYGKWKSDENQEKIREKVNDIIDIGQGIGIDASIGATFVIPVGGDAEFQMYFLRTDKNIYKLYRRGKIEAGFDTGVGFAAFFGLGKKTKVFSKKNGDPKMLGAGLSAGLQAQAQIGLHIFQEFTFDVEKDWAAVNFLYAALIQPMSSNNIFISLGAKVISYFMDFNLDPDVYLTKIRFDLGIRGSAGGFVQGGLNLGAKNEKDTWSNADIQNRPFDRGDHWFWKNILGLFNFSFFLTSNVSITGGITISFSDIGYNDKGTPFPNKISIEPAVTFNISVPVLSNFLPALEKIWKGYLTPYVTGYLDPNTFLNKLNGLGAKMKYTIDTPTFFQNYNIQNPFDNVNYCSTTLYKSTGEFDYYDGKPGYELGFEFDWNALNVSALVPPSGTTNFKQFFLNVLTAQNPFKSVYYHRRFLLSISPAGRRLSGLKTLMEHRIPNAIQNHDNINLTNFGIDANLSMDVFFEISGPTSIIEALSEFWAFIVGFAQTPFNKFPDILADIFNYFTTGSPPQKEINNHLVAFLDQFNLKKDIIFREDFGLEFGAGFQAALLGKVRIRVMMGGQYLGEYPIKISELSDLFQSGVSGQFINLFKHLVAIPEDAYLFVSATPE
jgi:hypothetical protein